uniref:Uncharacterized protein n=1 Tax=Caenorhabditis japonica TaxID=281687 RepID=A0A8R1HZI9_CAEJA
MTLSPETLLVVLAIAMCSLLLLFSVSVVIVFHCCKVETLHNLPHAVLERTRYSVNWARHSVFSHSQCDDFEDHVSHDNGTHRHGLHPVPTAV